MKISSSKIRWPLRAFPLLMTQRAGAFPMLVPGCNRTYRHETIALHLHDYAGTLWIGKRRTLIQPGDLTLSPQNTPSRYELPTGGSHLCVHFFPALPSGHTSTFRLPHHFRLAPQSAAARERLWRIIDHSRRVDDKPDSPAACAASATLQELLLWLGLQHQRGATPQRGSLMEEALAKLGQAIEASLATPMLIGELAANVGLSPAYVARLFVKRHGMTLQHYILLRRIELARHLLTTSDLPVSAVGRRAGLPDPQYFNKQFRRIAGTSPLAYRRAQQNP